jgi:hypothetical protein
MADKKNQTAPLNNGDVFFIMLIISTNIRFVMPDLIRHPDCNALGPGSEAGVTQRMQLIMLYLYYEE